MNSAREDLLTKLKDLKPYLRTRYHVQEIGLFGSFARAEQTTASDVDILVDFAEDASLFDLVGLERFLTERLGRKVDVVSRGALKEELRSPILQEVVLL